MPKKIEIYKNQKQEVTSMEIQCQLPGQDKQRNTKVESAQCMKLKKYNRLLDALQYKYQEDSLEKARMEKARFAAVRKSTAKTPNKYIVKRSEPIFESNCNIGIANHAGFRYVKASIAQSLYDFSAIIKESQESTPRAKLDAPIKKWHSVNSLALGYYLSNNSRIELAGYISPNTNSNVVNDDYHHYL